MASILTLAGAGRIIPINSVERKRQFPHSSPPALAKKVRHWLSVTTKCKVSIMSSGSDRDPPAGTVRDDAKFDALRTTDNVVRVDSLDAETSHAIAADGDVDEQEGDDAFVAERSLFPRSIREDEQHIIGAGSVAKASLVNPTAPTDRLNSGEDVKRSDEPGPL